MSLLNLFRRKPLAYRPVNAFEEMLDRNEDWLDPRAFARLLSTRTLLVFGELNETRDGVSLQTTTVADQSPLAFIFSSREAIEWYLTANSMGPQPVLSIRGKELFGILADGGFGAILNSGIFEPRVMFAANTKHVSSVMNDLSPPQSLVKQNLVGGFTLALPKHNPRLLIRAISHFLRTHSGGTDVLLALRKMDAEDQMTWAIHLRSERHAFERTQEFARELGEVINDVQDLDRLDLAIDFTVIEPAFFDEVRPNAILITKDGYEEPVQ